MDTTQVPQALPATQIVVDWAKALPVLVSTLAPTITGFLQQFSTKMEKANWLVKTGVNAVIGGLLGMIASYAASGDLLLSAASGVVLGSIGSVNIALRKGSRGNLEAVTTESVPTAPAAPAAPAVPTEVVEPTKPTE